MGPVDNTRSFLVGKLLEGMKRLKHHRDTRLPITSELLSKIIQILPVICTDLSESHLLSAAFSMAFACFLRVGELMLTKSTMIEKIIELEDKVMNETIGFFKINLRYSKTDQMGQGVVIQVSGNPSKICAFSNMSTYLKVRPQKPGPLFCHFNGEVLTWYQYKAILKKALNILNIPAAKYNSHSFRIGAATEVVERGYSNEEVRMAGRWKSSVFKNYIRMPEFQSKTSFQFK